MVGSWVGVGVTGSVWLGDLVAGLGISGDALGVVCVACFCVVILWFGWFCGLIGCWYCLPCFRLDRVCCGYQVGDFNGLVLCGCCLLVRLDLVCWLGFGLVVGVLYVRIGLVELVVFV